MDLLSEVKPAIPGSLQPAVLADLVALRNFLEGRDRALEALFKSRFPRSHLRDELIRMVVIEFGFGRIRTVAHYRRICRHLGRPFEVRAELRNLADHRLVMFLPEHPRRKAWHVCPTQRLIDWYSTQMPRLMTEVRRYVSSRGDTDD